MQPRPFHSLSEHIDDDNAGVLRREALEREMCGQCRNKVWNVRL